MMFADIESVHVTFVIGFPTRLMDRFAYAFDTEYFATIERNSFSLSWTLISLLH